MRCNIFKSIGAGDERMGTFLMFSQYTDDITKEQAGKSNYRVIPSKFIALNLDIKNAFNNNANAYVSSHITGGQRYSMTIGNKVIEGGDNIIPQILQSGFENACALLHNDENFEWDIDGRSIASELLWRTLEDWGFIGAPITHEDGFQYYDEIKYIGDINIHSNHKVGDYSYDEIFCHIPAKDDEYYYPLNNRTIEGYNLAPASETLDKTLEEWSDATYPTNNSLVNRAVAYHQNSAQFPYLYRFGGCTPVLDFTEIEYKPVPRNTNISTGIVQDNSEYDFNAILVFYDVVYSEPGEDPRYLYRFRPMGIYLSGPMAMEDGNEVPRLQNTFTKYITNNDAYGQGSSFGLRIMSRYVPTPNMTSYTMEVETDGGDYETILQAMGGIADAIVDIKRSYKDRHDMFQAYKDHLAQFRNRRVNVPYVRAVGGEPYWFINGRNTGQPVYSTWTPNPPAPQPSCFTVVVPNNPNWGSVVYSGNGKYYPNDNVIIIATPKPGYKFTKWIDEDGIEYVGEEYATYIFNIDRNRVFIAYFEATEPEPEPEPEPTTVNVIVGENTRHGVITIEEYHEIQQQEVLVGANTTHGDIDIDRFRTIVYTEHYIN